MADMSSIWVALASAAAWHDGHQCAAFTVKPGGLVGCPHGYAYEVGGVTLSPSVTVAGGAA